MKHVSLPRLHDAQRSIVRDSRRYNVVACGRRWGKTTMGVRLLIEAALKHGVPVAWVSPTYKMLAEVWRDVAGRTYPACKVINKSQHRLELHGGGIIDMWSAERMETIRGRKYALIVIDEAAMVRDLLHMWSTVLLPTMTDYADSSAWFLSTPRGLDDYHDLWQRGQHGGAWRSWQMPTSANPYIPPAAIDAARAELIPIAFAQEYEAQFVQHAGGLIKREWLPVVDMPANLEATVRAWDTAATPGSGDYTAGVLMGVRDGVYYILDVVRGQYGTAERVRVMQQTAAVDGRNVPIVVEQEPGSAGADAKTHLARDLAGYAFTLHRVTGAKATRAAPFAAQANAGNVRVVNGAWTRAYLDELCSFPFGKHDDQLDATGTAFNALVRNNNKLLLW